jgi:hypothetical protein
MPYILAAFALAFAIDYSLGFLESISIIIFSMFSFGLYAVWTAFIGVIASSVIAKIAERKRLG